MKSSVIFSIIMNIWALKVPFRNSYVPTFPKNGGLVLIKRNELHFRHFFLPNQQCILSFCLHCTAHYQMKCAEMWSYVLINKNNGIKHLSVHIFYVYLMQHVRKIKLWNEILHISWWELEHPLFSPAKQMDDACSITWSLTRSWVPGNNEWSRVTSWASFNISALLVLQISFHSHKRPDWPSHVTSCTLNTRNINMFKGHILNQCMNHRLDEMCL